MGYLTELQRLPTSGARAVAAFELGGLRYIAVPQLAVDAPGTPDGINGGSSDTRVLLHREFDGRFIRGGYLPAGGGEDVEVIRIGGRLLLAVASIRTGEGPYDFATESTIYEATAGGFVALQAISTYAAKQWRHFEIGDRRFLALAQNHPAEARLASTVYEWDGERFEPFQALESAAGYNFAAFELDGVSYLAHADHVLPSRLYRWDGARFAEHQELLPTGGGRAFQPFDQDGEHYLAVARIDGDSLVLRWDGTRFAEHSVLPGGAAAREFALIDSSHGMFLLRVNFILGSPAEPEPDLASFLYRVSDGHAEIVEEFRTTGGTDVTLLDVSPDGRARIAVSNGLAAHPAPGATFAADSVIYSFDPTGGM
ncbi:MAG TPA: hypothetical protein VGO65_11790 [Pseudolysinimonas sp.]|nr:hypothetical protein [Pseudolysinimonas sp.]